MFGFIIRQTFYESLITLAVTVISGEKCFLVEYFKSKGEIDLIEQKLTLKDCQSLWDRVFINIYHCPRYASVTSFSYFSNDGHCLNSWWPTRANWSELSPPSSSFLFNLLKCPQSGLLGFLPIADALPIIFAWTASSSRYLLG